MTRQSVEINIKGTVQGVGFRPFVYRWANQLEIKGSVSNNGSGVDIKAMGTQASLNRFKEVITCQTPPLAVIREFIEKPFSFKNIPESFSIISSRRGDKAEVDITRDTATCSACLKELFDPSDRRFEHPFINCTDCGPRYTIIDQLPYDRPLTAMSSFEMCDKCKAEYSDPRNRRYHAEPICCPECGPQLLWRDSSGKTSQSDLPLQKAVNMLEAGHIIAIKGIGGFHLACRADSATSVSLLRRRKQREDKPLAVMMPSIIIVNKYARTTKKEADLLNSPERPIVILSTTGAAHTLASSVAPRTPTLGVMLPYAPIHHLIFKNIDFDCLVMTSANHRSEPICHGNNEAFEKLSSIADGFLVHDRPIRIPLDDSIVRCNSSSPVLLRRARGYTPSPIPVKRTVHGIVALGGIKKSTVCVGRQETCYVSQYLGAAENIETLNNGEKVLKWLLEVLEVNPVCYVKDTHPAGFQSCPPGHESLPMLLVQHHHAHAAACMAENNLSSPAICVVYDGLGLGDDQNLWGGEIFAGDYRKYQRMAQLKYMSMPGGDSAAKHPGRMALGALHGEVSTGFQNILEWMPRDECEAVLDIITSGINCPKTSSMGRLFDAMSAILDVCRRQSYEGQPAMELESMADIYETGYYDIPIDEKHMPIIMDGRKLLHKAWQDYKQGGPKEKIAARFHNSIARLTFQTIRYINKSTGLRDVCLSGGCFQNSLLFQKLYDLLSDAGFNIYCHKALPPGDEAISFGQCMIAANKLDPNKGEVPCV